MGMYNFRCSIHAWLLVKEIHPFLQFARIMTAGAIQTVWFSLNEQFHFSTNLITRNRSSQINMLQ